VGIKEHVFPVKQHSFIFR